MPPPRNVSKMKRSDLQRMVGVDNDEWNNIRTTGRHNLLGARLKWKLGWALQKGRKIENAISATNSAHPILQKYQGFWLTRQLLKGCWDSRQDYIRRQRQGKAKSRRSDVLEKDTTSSSQDSSARRTRPPQRTSRPSSPRRDDYPSPSHHSTTPTGDEFDDGLMPIEGYVSPPSVGTDARGQSRKKSSKKRKVKKIIYETESDGNADEGSDGGEDSWEEGEAGPSSCKRPKKG